MPSIKDLKKRISSTKNTQQTTKAMKMVSAAKLRRAQDAITNQRPYAKQLKSLMQLVSALRSGESNSPLVGRPPVGGPGAAKKILILVVTSDRGLCGGFNSNVIKKTQKWIASNSASYESVTLSFLGRRGHDFFKSRAKTDTYYADLGGKVTFAKAKKLADSLVGQYLEGKYDEIKIIYNEFKNAISQDTRIDDFLPLLSSSTEEKSTEALPPYIVKPSAEGVFESLLAKNFSTQTFRVMLESQAGEHGARMSAMESATKNAGEMIKKLSLQYNKQRQAGITKELLEIIAGSESQKG